MSNIDDEWNNFLNNINSESNISDENINISLGNDEIESIDEDIISPKCSDIYISTTTKIAFFNQEIDIYDLFWKIPVIDYYIPNNGVIKKQIKLTCLNKEETESIKEKVKLQGLCKQHIISFYDNPKSKAKVNYKHVQKISVGTSKKDIMTYRTKEKGAFYNCFALIFRFLYNNEYKEVHVKVFNTGKLEIPGIQNLEILQITLDLLIDTLQPFVNTKLTYNKEKIDTVLINSNFNCGYFVNREKLYKKLKYTYNLICMYDPCSYPGVQCKFYYNEQKETQDGICRCKTKCSKKGSGNGEGQCLELSFMVFRTGSVLIVGHCDEIKLQNVYIYLRRILEEDWREIYDTIYDGTQKKQIATKKIKKVEVIIDNNEENDVYYGLGGLDNLNKLNK